MTEGELNEMGAVMNGVKARSGCFAVGGVFERLPELHSNYLASRTPESLEAVVDWIDATGALSNPHPEAVAVRGGMAALRQFCFDTLRLMYIARMLSRPLAEMGTHA